MSGRPAETVLVVGASSGIGRATALRFATRKSRLLLVSRSEPALQIAAAACRAAGSPDVAVISADVNDAAGVDAVLADAVTRWGGVDVVVHAAAVMAYGTIEDLPRPVYERVVDTTLHGTANVARTALQVFRQQGHGSLVIVSSLLASIAAPTMGAYTTAKWGQLGLIRTLQLETRDAPDIAISAVAPGGVDTPIYYQAATVTGSTGRPPPPVYTPDRVAKAIVDRVEHPRRLVQCGLANQVAIAGFRLSQGCTICSWAQCWPVSGWLKTTQSLQSAMSSIHVPTGRPPGAGGAPSDDRTPLGLTMHRIASSWR